MSCWSAGRRWHEGAGRAVGRLDRECHRRQGAAAHAAIQRCTVHKRRNVADHLPEGERGWVDTKLGRILPGLRESVGVVSAVRTDVHSQPLVVVPGKADAAGTPSRHSLTIVREWTRYWWMALLRLPAAGRADLTRVLGQAASASSVNAAATRITIDASIASS
jgi:hypothetical protein